MPRLRLFLLLSGSYALRVALALRGGQNFWPDEARYGAAQVALHAFTEGRWRSGFDILFGMGEHVLFRVIALPVAAVEQFLGPAPAFAACCLGAFSVLAILLVWAIARRSGADEEEAFWAAFLAAGSGSLFYFSRHYFPYDAALASMLAALWVGMGPPRGRPLQGEVSKGASFFAGVLAGVGFLIYNGYWLLGGCVLVVHVLRDGDGVRRADALRGQFRAMAARAAWAGCGLATPLAAYFALFSALGYEPGRAGADFAGTVVQGDFHLGHRVIAEYLWHAEGPVLALWLAAGACALAVLRGGERRRVGWWGIAVALLCGGLVLLSDVFPRFVVYGRLVRTLSPFLCLLAAAGIRAFFRRETHAAWRAIPACAVALGAAVNLVPAFRQVFPLDFHAMAARAVREDRPGQGPYRMLFAEFLWGTDLNPSLAGHEVIFSRSHPMQFRAYQYEGLSAAERGEMNRRDISMRVLRLAGDAGRKDSEWSPFPGPIVLEVALPNPTGRFGKTEPLVSSGVAGKGDFLFVRYVDGSHIAFAFDHWGMGELSSPPIAVDYSRPHEIAIVSGNLFPAAARGEAAGQALLDRARGRLLVMLDGALVFSGAAAFHPADPDEIFIGFNPIGGSSTGLHFTGRIDGLRSLPATALGTLLHPSGFPPDRGPAWAGYPGPLRLRLRPQPGTAGSGEPLLTTGVTGAGDFLFLRHEGGGRARIVLDHWGGAVVQSEPFALDPDREYVVELSIGSLLPPPEAAAAREVPALEALRGRIEVRLDGARLISTQAPTHPSEPGQMTLGLNRIGGSFVGRAFGGRILAVEPVPPSLFTP